MLHKKYLLGDKKGIIMGIYLVFITIFMVATSLFLAYSQNHALTSSLISPVQVMQLEDGQDMLKLEEQQAIKHVAESLQLKKDFIDYMIASGAAEKYIFKNIVIQGRDDWQIVFQSPDSQRAFLNQIYTLTSDGNSVELKREAITHRVQVKAPDRSKVNFGVIVEYTFDDSYSVAIK